MKFLFFSQRNMGALSFEQAFSFTAPSRLFFTKCDPAHSLQSHKDTAKISVVDFPIKTYFAIARKNFPRAFFPGKFRELDARLLLICFPL